MLCHSIKSVHRGILSKDIIEKCVLRIYFSSNVDRSGDFKPIYKYPYISIGAALNKIKKFQIVASSIAAPGSFITHAVAPTICDLNSAITISSVGLASTIAVCIVGQVFSNMIGLVYVSSDLQTVRFSFLDFWGRRKSIDFPREELIPIDHSASYFTDFIYRKVYRYSSTSPHKISLKSGEILNTEAFTHVFKYCPS